MYEPVFGEQAVDLFLFGSVLYSTFLVSNGSNALVFSDALEFFSKEKKKNWDRKN